MNFCSQSLWSGFGGIDDTTYINGHNIPMLMPDWYADSSTSPIDWRYIPSFMTWATGNYSNNSYGVRGYYTSLSNIKIGDIVYDTNIGHVMLVNAIVDYDSDGITDWNEIFISAHTSNRRNHNLKTLYGSLATPPTYFKYFHVYDFKYNDGSI